MKSKRIDRYFKQIEKTLVVTPITTNNISLKELENLKRNNIINQIRISRELAWVKTLHSLKSLVVNSSVGKDKIWTHQYKLKALMKHYTKVLIQLECDSNLLETFSKTQSILPIQESEKPPKREICLQF